MWLSKEMSAWKCIRIAVRDKGEASYTIKDDGELAEKTDTWSIGYICHNKGNESVFIFSICRENMNNSSNINKAQISQWNIKHLYGPGKFVPYSFTTKSHTYSDCDNTDTLSLSEHLQTCCTGTYVYHKGAAWCAGWVFFPTIHKMHSSAAPLHDQKSFSSFVLTHTYTHTCLDTSGCWCKTTTIPLHSLLSIYRSTHVWTHRRGLTADTHTMSSPLHKVYIVSSPLQLSCQVSASASKRRL